MSSFPSDVAIGDSYVLMNGLVNNTLSSVLTVSVVESVEDS